MSSSIKLTNSSGKIVTITNPDTTSADVAVDLLNNAYTIATVDDFGTVPVGYTTVIVKDTDRGGVFNRIASTTANGGTIFSGTTGYSWERQYSGAVNVKWFGAKGDGVTDDSIVFQTALDYIHSNTIDILINNLYDVSSNILYIPSGIYKIANELTGYVNLYMQGDGRSIIKGNGTNKFITADSLRYLSVKNLYFENFTTVFEVSSNNADVSNYFFEDIQVGGVSLFLDTVSYVLSRSTIVSLDRCQFTYSVNQICKAYVDKITFTSCWIGSNNSSTISIYANSHISVISSMFIPSGSGSNNRAWIKLTEDNGTGGTVNDTERRVNIYDCRFSNEGGNCPIVVCNYSARNEVHTTTAITIADCNITGYMTSTYKDTNSENGLIYLEKYPTSIKLANCNFYTLNSKLLSRDDSLTNVAPDSFIVDLDTATLNNASRAIGELSTYSYGNLAGYINNPDVYTFRGIEEDGNIPAITTATTGQYKATFIIRTGWTDDDYREPTSFFILLSGVGSTAINDYGYGGSSLYLVTISGYYDSSHKSKITTTKIAGDTFGLSSNGNANIVSAHFGTGDTGSTTATRATEHTITIAFGVQCHLAKARIIGLSKKISRYFIR